MATKPDQWFMQMNELRERVVTLITNPSINFYQISIYSNTPTFPLTSAKRQVNISADLPYLVINLDILTAGRIISN